MAAWWRDALDPRLSQGDVLLPIPLAGLLRPEVRLQKLTCKKGATHWEETAPVNKEQHFLAKGMAVHTVVLTHSCDLDKPQEGRVVVSPVFPIATLPPEHRSEVMAQERIAQMALPGLPDIGDCYADLRSFHSLPREVITLEHRLASMTVEGVVRLRAQLMEFFLRLPPDSLEKAIREGVEKEEREG